MKRYWADYSSREFAALEREKLIAVLPLGAIEQHGPHLPMSVDSCTVNGVVSRLAETLPETSPVVFLPTQAITKSNEHSAFPGSLTLSAETLLRAWTEIGACVARSGVRKIVLLNGHGGNIPAMDIVARELREKHQMMAFALSWFAAGMPEGVYSERERRHGIHAGDMETSVMLTLDPANVDMSQARDFPSQAEVWAQETPSIALPGPAKPAWLTQDLSSAGACGEAHLASAEKGEATLDHAVTQLTRIFDEIDRAPLSRLDAHPDW
ncbi:creatininase family protein [Salipiger sp. PrR002]|uniref:creatininase family protein n=1 Tax=Salipiger sp. PrR002 TaxID=2706489 RepID=UPI0013BC31D9|nr:creatininase family protein [Salipiger sp. PrR002]NDW00990.1 creatininase family protein [Salipiger sp. PrR002]NDW56537.1 creatininase family protein [Salipiger sp. PrR004]